MDRETTRNDDESTTASATWSDAEFRAVADDFGSRTERLDETLAAQRETTGKLADELRAIQTDVVRELNVSADRGEQYMDAFRTVADYNAKMASNAEAKRTAARLECELFQKRYETTRRGEKLVDEEQRLASRSRELKRSVRRQAAYNKELSRRYVRLTESQQHG